MKPQTVKRRKKCDLHECTHRPSGAVVIESGRHFIFMQLCATHMDCAAQIDPGEL